MLLATLVCYYIIQNSWEKNIYFGILLYYIFQFIIYFLAEVVQCTKRWDYIYI